MREVYMVNVNWAGFVFVKTYEYFRDTAGFTKDWGIKWVPVVATSIEDAREKGCSLPGARTYESQAK